MGVKYPALVWAGVLAAGMASRRRRGGSASRESESRSRTGRDRRPDPFSTLGLVDSPIPRPVRRVRDPRPAAWWYLRAYVHTGNPVFPFFRALVRRVGDRRRAGPDQAADGRRPPWNLLTAIGPITLDPNRFDSLSHQFGPAFLLFLPGLFVLRPPRRVVGIAGDRAGCSSRSASRRGRACDSSSRPSGRSRGGGVGGVAMVGPQGRCRAGCWRPAWR